MKNRLAIGCLLLLVSTTIVSCDKGKKPYEEAEVLLNKSDYSGAKVKAMEVVQNTPNSKYLTQASAIIEKVDQITSLFTKAELYLQEKDYKKAIQSYEDVLTIEPKGSKATTELKKVQDIYKNELMKTGDSLFQGGNFEAALEKYKEILSLDSNAPDVLMAISKVEKAINETPSFTENIMQFMGKSKDIIISNLGEPDRLVEVEPGIIRFIYGETLQGWITEDIFRITPAIMFDFKGGRVFKITKSFKGAAIYGGDIQEIRGFPRVKDYADMKELKPTIERKGEWAGVTWKGEKYSYWARCITTQIDSYGRKKRIERVDDYYLAMFEIQQIKPN